MSSYQSKLMQTLTERGFLYQCTDETALDAAAKDQITGYIGFDCTAPTLHVGSLVQIMMLRHLQKAGGRPIVLLGGGTKRRQSKDIDAAKTAWKDYKARKRKDGK